ncbi:UNVERIFIED_ORG: drug/metabolite transporter (DMT)-like permease [Methylobacterium sp. SuP10 SLI 274]|uniref:DMT family transporter n=1 Tax=Methylorubrum extorquens TaxID=408 RepID=UPI00209C81FF|nr:DMT family transporter [Methylorubrum extorquens]MDF9863384.1 drug/metabolite transporter (DMT)-like permease [Methylorubrum pseudosasae]MDH6636993.1 drug/metabolite transporter (DMT)-like permease [Methylobacterium sp. SuP10 SLI 274]MDH6666170.1 drug/metabolite transporter (DMT)-like permease [Methylorubrum zatmanii]MCP1558085.1 drug/metabolite transporter (DMT)-like permease [Methylorubrum extorquens]MDF9791695.1 drug/metabolite transporter (DMT)-like permease [Methylorubrum extorquens]
MPEHHTNNSVGKTWHGWGHGLLGVLIFSGSLPATRVAVGGFTPLFLTASRAVIAAGLGGALLALLRQKRPARGDLMPLAVVALGVVVGFPLLTALVLRHITSARSIVFIGLLPLATALFGLLGADDRPNPAFWLFSGVGSVLVAGFALARSDGADLTGDGLMLGAILLCGLGYAEGARLSRRLGGWQVIAWALVLAAPAMAVLALATLPDSWAGIGLPAWAGLGYVSVFSMLVGFVFWYRGLALGGIAGVGQLQLLQPFFGLALAGLLLGEPVEGAMVAVAAGVVLCVVAAKRFA